MNGLIVVNKEENYTSRDVVNVISKSLGIKKVGHTGTLDPLATGVLVVCIGQGTKLVEVLTCEDKEYIATIKLGIKTNTGDITGEIIKKENYKINKEKVINIIESFQKKYLQTVPIYSAVRIDGKKLYEYARENIEVSLPSREVNIKKIEVLEFIDEETFTIKCLVTKGTYIRSLIEDIASSLNTIGTMTSLKRVKQGEFHINESFTLEEIKNKNFKLIKIEEILKNYFTVDVDSNLEFQVKNGTRIKNIYNEETVVFKKDDTVLAIYKNDSGMLKVFKMFDL